MIVTIAFILLVALGAVLNVVGLVLGVFKADKTPKPRGPVAAEAREEEIALRATHGLVGTMIMASCLGLLKDGSGDQR
jgi:hypothetical protein